MAACGSSDQEIWTEKHLLMPELSFHPAAAAFPDLTDGMGRRFEYLRLSLTDVCNFSCTYCLPSGYKKKPGKPAILSPDEIVRAVAAFAQLGLWKIRLTGGEPTVRQDFTEISRRVALVPGIRRVAMTTNGYRLTENAFAWRQAGVSAINISIDSLDPASFASITGHDKLHDVLAGVEAARCAGFDTIKLNAVLMRGVNDAELGAMIDFVQSRDLSLRFIEVMRTNENPAFFERHHLPGYVVVDMLERLGWSRLGRASGVGPAVEYGHPRSRGRIGVIAPYSHNFCTSCNRLRLSADGRLHLCLFGDGGHDLRPLLQNDTQKEDLAAHIAALTSTKAPAHRLHEGNSGLTPHLASIGG